jgi:hypothetical protein
MEYRGWKIDRFEGTQLGYRTENGKRGKGRTVRGYAVIGADLETPKIVATIKEAKSYVDSYLGTER